MTAQGMIHFLETWLGESWRTSLGGVVLIGLGALLSILGALLTISSYAREAGLVILAQGTGLIIAGMSLRKARDQDARRPASAPPGPATIPPPDRPRPT